MYTAAIRMKPIATSCQNGSTFVTMKPFCSTAGMKMPIDRADDGADAAEEARAAEHHAGDDLQRVR